MKRLELKKKFENEFKDINVSEELKKKTINKIYLKSNVYHLPYWIKNCAAIFIVTCICLSIWLVNNKNLFENVPKDMHSITNQNTSEIYLEDTYSPTESEVNSIQKSSSPKVRSFMALPNNMVEENQVETSLYDEALPENNLLMYAPLKATNIEEDFNVGILVEEFLINYPYAQKVENGYIIKVDGMDTLYIVENGYIIEKENI